MCSIIFNWKSNLLLAHLESLVNITKHSNTYTNYPLKILLKCQFSYYLTQWTQHISLYAIHCDSWHYLILIIFPLLFKEASFLAQTLKNLPAVGETWVQSLGREDHLEEGMATYSSILVWRIPWIEEPGSLQSMGQDMTEWLTLFFIVWCTCEQAMKQDAKLVHWMQIMWTCWKHQC